MKSFISILDAQFRRLHERNCAFISLVPTDKIYWRPRENHNGLPVYSCGEYILRSAGKIEQTFGGITTKLWDDPFEWTLPEELFDNAKILEYLGEVEITRVKGFTLFASDADLNKEILAASGLKTIFALLLETLAHAENFQGRAFATFRLFSDEQLPH
ncbi:MAG: hypothetical protein ABI954_06385 [Pyrinomonadaceae bacterium]